jgi:hypothetical protein
MKRLMVACGPLLTTRRRLQRLLQGDEQKSLNPAVEVNLFSEADVSTCQPCQPRFLSLSLVNFRGRLHRKGRGPEKDP